MKHKRDSSLDAGSSALATKMSAEELRECFAELNPHIPLSAYDALLSQYAPSTSTPNDTTIMNTSQSMARQALKSSRKKVGDEMYETIPSSDLKFLLPGDTLTVFSHKAFPEQFEFSLHYMDKVTGQLKSVVAPHQAKWRAFLSISRPSSGPIRSSVSGPYNQITFTAPSRSTVDANMKSAGAVSSTTSQKSSFSSFIGSYFRKAGILEALPDLNTLELSDSGVRNGVSSSTAQRASSAPSMSLARASTAPSTPTTGSPRNGSSPSSSSDDSGIQHFVSSALITSSFHTNQETNVRSTTVNGASRRLMPVAISFRTRITSNGNESIVASPLFILCDAVEQVDLFVCRVFRNALPESYPSPSTIISDSLPPRASSTSSSSKKSSTKSSSTASSTTQESSKVEKTTSEPKKASKSSHTSKSDAKSDSKSESKHKRTSSSRSKSPSGKADSAAPSVTPSVAPVTAPVAGKCKPEVPVIETSRFHALKFW